MSPADEHRDRKLERAWRAASREEPPTALDAAIAAAARRAVGAGPRHAHASRAWWPVAAAAAVALVAIGIVEMTPPEQVAPTVLAPAPQAGADARQESNDATDAARAAPQAGPVLAPQPAPEAKRREAAPPASQRQAKTTMSSQTPQGDGDSREQALPRVAEPMRRLERGPTAAGDEATASAPAARAAPAAVGNPFPATPADASAPAALGAAAGALPPRQERSLANAPGAYAKPVAQADAQRGEAPPRSVAEWIALLRRLKADGKNEVLAHELAAFRAAYGDRADPLLPSDLRGAKP